jgi:hypothetical protein
MSGTHGQRLGLDLTQQLLELWPELLIAQVPCLGHVALLAKLRHSSVHDLAHCLALNPHKMAQALLAAALQVTAPWLVWLSRACFQA